MGVMECNRKGCENILCSLLSDKYGYICSDCFDEMKESGLSIGKFMSSEKKADEFDYENEFEETSDSRGLAK